MLHNEQMRIEADKQALLMKQDLIEQIKSLKVRVHGLEEEKREQERRFEAFKLEYSKALEDRDSLKTLSERLQREIEAQTMELLNAKKEQLEQA